MPNDVQRMDDGRRFDSRYAYRTMLLLVLLIVVVLYVEGMLTPSLPRIALQFGVTDAQASLLLALYAASGTAMNPVVGKLGDIYGKKRVLMAVMVAYAVAVTVTGFSPNFVFMLGSRTVQGIGLSIMPLTFSIVREEFPRELIPRATGLLSGMFGVGFAISFPIGAFISNNYGWQTTYHTAAPLVIVLTVLVFVFIRESIYRRPITRVDYVGAGLLGASLAMAILALSEGPTWGWFSISILALFAMALILLVPLAVYERAQEKKTGEPILNFRLLSLRNVLDTNIALAIVSFGMFLAFYAYVYKFENPPPSGFGYDIFQTGLSFLPLAIAMFIFSPIAGWLSPKVGVKPVAIAGNIIAAVGFLLTSQTTTSTQFLLTTFVIGAGFSIVNAAVINLLVLTVEPKDIGVTTSLNSVFRNLGTSLGPPIAGSLMTTFTAAVLIGLVGGNPVYANLPTTAAYQYAFYIAAAALISVAFLLLSAKEVLGKKAVKS